MCPLPSFCSDQGPSEAESGNVICKSGVVKTQSHSAHNAEGTEEQDPVRIEEESKQLRVAGSCRLNTKFTCVVAQKTVFGL